MFNQGLFLQVGQFPMHLSTLVWTIALRGLILDVFTQKPRLFVSQGQNPNIEAQVLSSGPKSQPWGPNSSLEGPNSALKAKIQPCHPNLSPKTQIPKSGKRRRKFPTWVKAQVIKPFGAAALLPPSTSITTYLGRAQVLLTIKPFCDYSYL